MDDRVGAPIRALVVDDEWLSRQRVRSLLDGEQDVVVVGECENGLDALTAITERRPEIVLLDVHMPELDGFGVVDALGGAGDEASAPEIIFVTAHDAYMERAFEAHAVDYLRKPYTDERFASALTAARRRVLTRRRAALARPSAVAADEAAERPDSASGGTRTPVQSVVESLREERRDTRLAVQDRRRGTWDLVPKETVTWIAVDGESQVRVHADGKEYAWRKSIGEVERLLGDPRFLRVHRSYLVNGERIRQVKALTKGEYAVTLTDGTVLDTGRSYRKTVEAFLRDR